MDIWQRIGEEVLQHGLVGVGLLVVGWLAWKLYRENGKLRDEMLTRELSRANAYHDLARHLDETLRVLAEAYEKRDRRWRRRQQHEEG